MKSMKHKSNLESSQEMFSAFEFFHIYGLVLK